MAMGSNGSIIELFSGAGGLALGLSELGYRSLGLIEYDKPTCITLRQNKNLGTQHVKDWPIFEMDVRDVDYSTFKGPIELLTGGPPCQPFSFGGKGNAHNDARDMFPQAVRAIRELRPKAFIFENVKGLTRAAFSEYFEYIVLQMTYPSLARKEDETWQAHLLRLIAFRKSGAPAEYNVKTKLLNAANYGVPQRRERVFFVGIRADLNVHWQFPAPTHSAAQLLYDQYVSGEYWIRHNVPAARRPISKELSSATKYNITKNAELLPTLRPWQTVRDAIHDLPEPTLQENADFYNHVLRPGAKIYPGHTGSPIDEPSKTIKAGSHGVPGGENMIAFNDGTVRYMTVRESARIQTFPDDYHFPVSWGESMRQLGNAVPVRLGYTVARSVQMLLNSDSDFVQPPRQKEPSRKHRQRASALASD